MRASAAPRVSWTTLFVCTNPRTVGQGLRVDDRLVLGKLRAEDQGRSTAAAKRDLSGVGPQDKGAAGRLRPLGGRLPVEHARVAREA